MRKEDLRLAARLTTNMIPNMGKGKHISTEICLDNVIIKVNDMLEDILIAEFDMERIRAYREQETWGNACRKPASY